jgi:hypothetical protein
MATKKKTKTKKQDRRLKEIVKAHAKGGMRGEYIDIISGANDPEAKQPRKLSHRLDLGVIKTDLIKTAMFVVFAVVLLFILKKSGLDLYFGINK